MTPLVSVIVPVYKVEPYLDKCIESIVNQTYRNLEILLVDDGSPDRCPQMCDAWAEKDARIRVIHQENGGLSEARNAGMRIAAGEYLSFVDSDDYVTADFIERLLNLAVTTGSDIACCGIEKVWEDGKMKRYSGTFSGVLSNEDAIQAITRGTCLNVVVWNKLYRKEVIAGLSFPRGKYHEDIFWSCRAIANANQVAVTPEIGNFYLQRSDSIKGKSYSLKRLDSVEAAAERATFLEEHYPRLAAEGRVRVALVCLYNGQQAITYLRGAERRQAIQFLKRTMREHPLHRGDTRGMQLSRKCMLLMAKISFSFTCFLRYLVKRKK